MLENKNEELEINILDEEKKEQYKRNCLRKNKVYLSKLLNISNAKEECECPLCASKGFKYGKTSQDVQRYKCKKCNITFSHNHKTGQTTSKDLKIAQKMYNEGKTRIEIAEAIKKTEITVFNLIKKGLLISPN